MLTMEYYLVDELTADALMIDDLIGIDDEIYQIIGITSTPEGFLLQIENEFGEREVIDCNYDDKFNLFIYQ